MQNTLFIISIIIAFIIFFTLLWTGIVYLISRLSGWASLAGEFPAIGRVQGNVYNWCSARFRYFANYSNCLTVIVSPAGIYMQPIAFLKIGHKPIMIPREAISELECSNTFLFATANLEIKAGDDNRPITITLYGKRLVTNLAEWFGQRSG